jgi:type IV pilus assembly protein PilM
MDVVMAIAPQSAIDTLIASVKRAGRTAVGIDVEPLAIARSLQVSYAEEFENMVVCVVDMGHKTTSINIYKSGKLLMPRQIPIGGENFTKSISDHLGIGMDDAERLKLEKARIPQSSIEAAKSGGFATTFGLPPVPATPGATQEFTPYNPFSDEPMPAPLAAEPVSDFDPVPIDEPFAPPAEANPFELADAPPAPVASGSDDPDSVRTFNAFSSVLEEFVAEVRRSIDYFRSRGGEVNRILLCGGATELKGLSEYLGVSMALACDAYDPFQHLTVNERKIAPGFVEEHKQEFAVAVGTGLHIFFD